MAFQRHTLANRRSWSYMVVGPTFGVARRRTCLAICSRQKRPIGEWPIGEYPVQMSETPGSIAGRVNRGAPCYGEDNYEVFGDLLGLSTTEVDRLAENGIV